MIRLIGFILVVIVVSGVAMAQNAVSFEAVAKDHPVGETLKRIFADGGKSTETFAPTGMSRKDYLPLIAGNVDWWGHFQDGRGAIVDPFESRERQYSTPAFALAAALLVKEDQRDDLLDPATRAMSRATEDLAIKKTADGHADFYIPMLIHARRLLKDRVKPEVLAKWDEQLKSIVPEKIYSDTKGGANWNVVNLSGEYLRRKDGLVAKEQRAAQLAYLEGSLDNHANKSKRFTKFGMFSDPSVPLAYDAFPRLWLEDAVADGAVEGEWGMKLSAWLAKGGFSSLLLVSPSGEWASGGRSAQHQWNEAESAEIFEINANKWKQAGRADIAGAFKRAARLCLTSMYRWQRPSGEMWIVKNFADPARRHGFEGYSFHSQYNLLPMGMLAIAYLRADDSIEEKPMPSESAGYVFDVREIFHHVAAACGGYYVLIDTAADHHYGSSGVQRVHRSGVDLSAYTDTPSPESWIGPADAEDRAARAVGLEWKDGQGIWRGLAQYGQSVSPPKPKAGEEPRGRKEAEPQKVIERADLTVAEAGKDRVAFSIKYETSGVGARPVEEEIVITRDGVEGTQRIGGDGTPATRVVLPALVNDGARETDVSVDGNKVTIARKGALTRDWREEKKPQVVKPGGVMRWEVAGADVKLGLTGPLVVTHNGFVQALVGELPAGVREVKWRMTLEAEKKREQ